MKGIIHSRNNCSRGLPYPLTHFSARNGGTRAAIEHHPSCDGNVDIMMSGAIEALYIFDQYKYSSL